MYQTIHFEAEPGKWLEHVVPNVMQLVRDSDHTKDLKTRKSMYCILEAICSVVVHWHMGKQSCITRHSMDAEIGAYFSGTMMNKYLRGVHEAPPPRSNHHLGGQPTNN